MRRAFSTHDSTAKRPVRSKRNQRSEANSLAFPGMWIYVPLGLFLGGLALWAVTVENDFSFYWRDPAAITNTGPWIGLFSNIGVFLWWIAAAVSVFSALALRSLTGFDRAAAFLLSWGLITGALALDDYFMLHEWVVPTYLPVPGDLLFVAYFVILVGIVFVFRREILRSRWPVLLLAMACLGASLLVDLIGPDRFLNAGLPIRLVWNLEYIVEDGMKFVGVIAWLHYLALTSHEMLTHRLRFGAEIIRGRSAEEVHQRPEIG